MPKRSSFWWTAARRLVASAVGPLLLISGFLALEAAGALPRCNCGWCFGVALGYARSLTPHRPAGLESRAISALRAISSAQSLFREGHKDRVRGYGSLAQLGTAGLVDPHLASGVREGYRFYSQPSSLYTWWAFAEPTRPGCTGDRVFYTDERGQIFYTVGSYPITRGVAEVRSHFLPVGQ
ncbi:MAG TPA: hypothetical protein DEA08_20390 [Planctomycetes bacterium]|nr:hypothetical protein [Planctomycetota bacterium]